MRLNLQTPADQLPTVPASGTAFTNNTGQDQAYFFFGGTTTVVNHIRATVVQQVGTTTPAVVICAPGDGWSITYSAAPTAVQVTI
jgi:hypothetical protein